MRMLIPLFAAMIAASAANADRLGVRDAELTMLRVHDVGTAFGPASDQIDVEVVVQVAERNGSFGFQLRDDGNRLARRGMLDLLRDAMDNPDLRINFDYDIEPPDQNGVIMRVWLTRAGS